MKKYPFLLLSTLITFNTLLSFNIQLKPFNYNYCAVNNAASAEEEENTQSPESENSSSEADNSEDNSSASENLNIAAPSYILLEASTQTILLEKDADVKLAPASITKIMTLILIYDALKTGKISLDDTVTVSEYAASMGGSQVFLEAGETQTVETLIKCICIASANDAWAAYIL